MFYKTTTSTDWCKFVKPNVEELLNEHFPLSYVKNRRQGRRNVLRCESNEKTRKVSSFAII